MPESLPPIQEGKSSPLKQIRTFQGDVAEALGRQKESLFSIQQTEHLKQASGGRVTETTLGDNDERSKFLLLAIGGLVLILLSLLGAWYGYHVYINKTAPPVIVAPESRIIPSQSEAMLNLASSTRESLITFINEKSAGVTTNELRHFIFPLSTTAQFFQTIQSKAPGSLVRSFDPLFMFGTLGQNRFIIIKLSSFENTFPGMLAWEKDMAQDLGPLFATAPKLKNIGSSSVFKDVISHNKDVRVLNAGDGTSTEPVLLYSFFDNQMLIITDNLETLKILIDRLTQNLLVH